MPQSAHADAQRGQAVPLRSVPRDVHHEKMLRLSQALPRRETGEDLQVRVLLYNTLLGVFVEKSHSTEA